jgi:signal transduction histidine kinase
MATLNKIYVPAIVILPFVITSMHFWLFEPDSPPIVLEEIYYIPLFLGILRFGLKGALWNYGIVSLAYAPFFFGIWTTSSLALLDRFLHMLFSGVFAFLAGFLIDREREQRKRSEKDRYLAGIGQAATTIVHDLKNPLISILGFAKRIREGKGEIGKAAEAIWESAHTMQKIVESTLDFARPIRLDVKESDLKDIINKVLDSCKIKAEESGVSLSVRVPTAPMKLVIDAHHMERALLNLVSNCIEASGSGQQVLLSAENEGADLVIRVKDNGVGMDKETLENIFVPFYTKKKKGTGLGMPIVKKIVESHSGKLMIRSRPGQGTEFVLHLPDLSLGKAERPRSEASNA